MSDEYIFLKNAEETIKAGENLGQKLLAALVAKEVALPFLITLSGDLGAGKTTFAKGLSYGLGAAKDEEIQSPTFTLANEYKGAHPIFHLDLYRLEPHEFYEAGLDEYLTRPGFTLVEWPERMPESVWPAKRLDVFLSFERPEGRSLRIKTSVQG